MRSSLFGIAFAASCAASPLPQAPNDAEKLYRKMEAALAGAKDLVVTFKSSTAAPGATEIKGSFKIGGGNKLEMNVTGQVGVKKYSLALTSDGSEMSVIRSESPPPPVPLEAQPALPAPKTLTANVAAALARGGAWLAQEFADTEYRTVADAFFNAREKNKDAKPQALPGLDVTTWHTLANFQLGKAEGGAAAVTYDLKRAGEKPPLVTTITVWIDSKTSMPVKREGSIFALSSDGKVEGAALSRWSETYSKTE